MLVIPAIDLAGGQVVRLRQGDFNQVTSFAETPAELAARFAEAGARWLHVVDLDAARSGLRGEPHASLLTAIAASTGARLQVGGGFRSEAAVDEALAAGVERVVVGTLALREPETYRRLVDRHGERIAMAADALAGSVRVAGWLEDGGEPVVELVRRLDAEGTQAFLVTAIERDGMLEGPDLELLERVRDATSATLLASGGVGSLDDLRRLAAIGCDGAIVGRALLEGHIDLGEAIRAARARG